MFPALVGTLVSMYATARAVDTARYYYDYHENTGKWPRYPFYRNTGGGYAVNAFSNLKRL